MADLHDTLVAVLRTHEKGGERPSRCATGQAADRLEHLAEQVAAYRSVALHYMTGRSVIDRRNIGGGISFVGAGEATDAETAALVDLWAELDLTGG